MMMAIFMMLNPSLRHPFENNMPKDDAVLSENTFKNLLRQKTVPTCSDSFLKEHALMYQELRSIFYSFFEYDPKKRPTASEVQDILKLEFTSEMHYTPLENLQSTAIEKIDLQLAEAIDKKEFVAVDVTNDGTNACAFLTIGIIDRLSDVDLKSDFKKEVEETISEFPNLFNPSRNVGSFYDIYEAYNILESHQLLKNKFVFQEDFLNKKNMFTLDSYLCLKKILSIF